MPWQDYSQAFLVFPNVMALFMPSKKDGLPDTHNTLPCPSPQFSCLQVLNASTMERVFGMRQKVNPKIHLSSNCIQYIEMPSFLKRLC
jgi:hypothetical protein